MSIATESNRKSSRVIQAPTGSSLTCKSWLTEAPLRMLMNNLDPDVAEIPGELVVYGGIGRAARNWECYDKIVETLQRLENDQTLLVQSGKPSAFFRLTKTRPASDRQQQPRSQLGQLGAFPRTRQGWLDDVRPDDSRFVDLHRQSGNRSRDL